MWIKYLYIKLMLSYYLQIKHPFPCYVLVNIRDQVFVVWDFCVLDPRFFPPTPSFRFLEYLQSDIMSIVFEYSHRSWRYSWDLKWVNVKIRYVFIISQWILGKILFSVLPISWFFFRDFVPVPKKSLHLFEVALNRTRNMMFFIVNVTSHEFYFSYT